MPIYSFPSIGNPSSASTRSVMLALGLVMLSLFTGFGVTYLIGLLGFNTNNLLWVPVLTTAPAVVFAMFAVVKDEAHREARFRDMSTLVADALVLVSGIELSERDIRRMVEGDVIEVQEGTLRVEEQKNGRSKTMTLMRDDYPETQEPIKIHKATIEAPSSKPEMEPKTESSGASVMPVTPRPQPSSAPTAKGMKVMAPEPTKAGLTSVK